MDTFFNVTIVHMLDVPENWYDEAFRRRDCYRNVDVISIKDGGAVDNGVDHRLVLQGVAGGFYECRHETKLDAVFFHKSVQVVFAESYDCAHVELVEGGQHGVGGLRFLQSLANLLAHFVHWDPELRTRT